MDWVSLEQAVGTRHRLISTRAIDNHIDVRPSLHVILWEAVEMGERSHRGQAAVHVAGDACVGIPRDDLVGEIVAQKFAIDAIAAEEDMQSVTAQDAVEVTDAGVVRSESVEAGDVEEGCDVAGVDVGGYVVGPEGEFAAAPTGGFQRGKERGEGEDEDES